MSRIQEPLKWAKHPELLSDINNMIIALKLAQQPSTPEIEEAKLRSPRPTTENVVNILQQCYKIINELREDPRKY